MARCKGSGAQRRKQGLTWVLRMGVSPACLGLFLVRYLLPVTGQGGRKG